MNFYDAHDAHPYLLLVGCVVAPRFVIAALSLAYWDTNPVLVVFAWLFAFTSGGESANETRKKFARTA